MYVQRILYSDIGRIFISILLGLGLSTLFRKVCDKRECLVFKAAPLENIKEKIFKFNNKCYKFEDSAVTCNKNKKVVKFK